MEEDMLNNLRRAYNRKKLYSQVIFFISIGQIFQPYHKESYNMSSEKQPVLYFSQGLFYTFTGQATRRQSRLQDIYCVICNVIITNYNSALIHTLFI